MWEFWIHIEVPITNDLGIAQLTQNFVNRGSPRFTMGCPSSLVHQSCGPCSVKLNHQAVIGLFLVPHGPPNQQNSRHPMSMFHSSQETLETLSDWAESPEDAVQFLGKACKARHGIAIDD